MNNARETIAAAAKGGTLRILGYRTGSGAEINYTVRLLGPQGYRELVRESLEKTKDITRPDEFDSEVWAEALKEKIASFQRTLDGETVSRNFARSMMEHEGYSSYEDEPDTFILRNLLKVSEEIVTPGEVKMVKSAAKTLAKAAMDKMLPIGKYLGQLNLAPGKYNSVTHHHDIP